MMKKLSLALLTSLTLISNVNANKDGLTGDDSDSEVLDTKTGVTSSITPPAIETTPLETTEPQKPVWAADLNDTILGVGAFVTSLLLMKHQKENPPETISELCVLAKQEKELGDRMRKGVHGFFKIVKRAASAVKNHQQNKDTEGKLAD